MNNTNNYLIPANTKRGQLILGFFTKIDLIVWISGVAWTLLMLIIVKSLSMIVLILVMLPGLITTFLIMPVPHYHNVLQLLTNIVTFYTNRRQYYWKGWCVYNESSTNNK